MTTEAAARTLRSRSRRDVTGLVFSALLVAAVVALWWSAPREDVADPGPGATPEQVVLTYIEAVNTRDFATSNLIDARPGEDLGRFSRPLQTHDVQGLRTRMVGDSAHVLFTADFDGTDGSLEDGPWGYYLERGDDGAWHIVDAGVA